MRSILVLVVLAACHGAAPSSPVVVAAPPDAISTGETRCDRDGDCVVTNFAGCCACPQCAVAAPHVLNRAAADLDVRRCEVASCDASVCGAAGACAPGESASHFVARCRDHACAMQRAR
jgi:hypothetical protein